MEKKKFQSVSIAALIVSILPLAALAPSLLHLSLSDGVRTAWAGANIVFVLLGLILSVVCVRSRESRSIKDTSSRPAKDLGGTLRRTLRTTLRSYDSRASGDLFCPRRQGGVANMTSNPNRITVAAPGFYPKISFRLVRLFKY